MSTKDEDLLLADLQAFYLQSNDKVTKEEVTPVVKWAENFAKSNRSHHFIKLTFSSFKKHLKKDNFGITSTRFLKLVDQLLQLSAKVAIFRAYGGQVSKGIVDIYLFVFTLIFQYQILQSALVWKLYRMLWAKLITDEAFDTLRAKVAQKFNKFDLNRGFSNDHLEKIKKRFNRKAFSQAEINRYLDSTKLQPKKSNSNDPHPDGIQPEKKRHVEPIRSSISPVNLRQNPHQKNPVQRSYSPFEVPPGHYQQKYPSNPYGNNIDPYYYPQNNQNESYPNYPPKPELMSMNYGYNPNPYLNAPPNNYMPIPAKTNINANMRPNNYPPYMPPNNYSNSNSMVNPLMNGGLGHQMGYNMMTPNLPTNSYNNPNTANPPSINNKNYTSSNLYYEQNKNSKITEQSQDKSLAPTKQQKPPKNQPKKQSIYPNAQSDDTIACKQLRFYLTTNLHQCRQCGLLVQTKEFLEEHIQSHLLQAQNQYFRKQSESLGQNKTNNPKVINGRLLSTERWINSSSSQKASKPYQISIAGLNKQTGNKNCLIYNCYFCQQELSITWCQELQDWTLKDTIKLRTGQELTVSHFSCFNHFNRKNHQSEDTASH